VRHQSATAHELSRVAELAGLPGETLARLGERMTKQELAPGEHLDLGDRFAVVLMGMVSAPGGILRPGDPASGRVRAMTPAAVASCDRAVYAEVTGR
jgi:hypothetical protein